MKKPLIFVFALLLGTGTLIACLFLTGPFFKKIPEKLFNHIKKDITSGLEEPATSQAQPQTHKIIPYTSTSRPDDIALRMPVRKCTRSNGQEEHCEDYIDTLTYMNLADNMYSDAEMGDINSVRNYVEKYHIPPDIYHHPKNGTTAFFTAVAHHHFDIAQLLLSYGADINGKFAGGISTLIYSIARGDVEAVKYLLQAHADINSSQDSNGDSLLDFAKSHFRKDPTAARKQIVKLLQQFGARSSATRTRMLFGIQHHCITKRQDNDFSHWECSSNPETFSWGFIETIEDRLQYNVSLAREGVQTWRKQFPSAKDKGYWEQQCPNNKSIYIFGKQVAERTQAHEYWVSVTPYSLLYLSLENQEHLQKPDAVIKNLCNAWI